MRTVASVAMSLLLVVGVMPIPAWADSPHYIELSASFDPSTADYTVSLKEAGLGTATSVTYTLSANATFTVVCVNKGGNEVQGQPKSGSGSATTTTTLAVHHGQTTGTITIGPAAFSLPDPGCTDSQRLEITAAQYIHVVLSDGLGSAGAGDQSLPSLGGSNLSVIL